ncbi:MAG: hypothetical protein FJY97_16680 [candidate division Zixibacteria bacterium]|nr:hypothetical protein [candidate division Zixibacteria bacterium]
MSITDALNRPEEELFWINRTPLHDHYYAPFFSAYDPFRNIRHAQVVNGWIIDYCHCPLETPVHPNKDCSQAQLRQRFEMVLSEGGDEVWTAVPEEVVSYHLMRRHTRVETVDESALEYRYRLYVEGLPGVVPYRTLTFEALVPAAWCRDPKVRVDGVPIPATLARPQTLRITVETRDGMEMVFRAMPSP